MTDRFYQTYYSAIEKVKKDTREASLVAAINGVDATIQVFEKDLAALDGVPMNIEDLLIILKEQPKKALPQIIIETRERIRQDILTYLARLNELKVELIARKDRS